MQFYSVQLRRAVEVPDGMVERRTLERPTKTGGVQVRYLLSATAEVDGRTVRLAKFVSKAEFEALERSQA